MKHKTDVLGQRFTLSKAIDFMRGANARVFLGTYTQEKGIEHSAIKIMRTDSSDPQSRKYIQIFQTELLILTTLKDTPGISSPRDCGLIKFDNIHNMDDDVTVEGQTGEVIHMGPDGLLELHEKLNNDNLDDWLPFLSIELRSQNLEICFDRIIRDRNGSVDSFLMPVPSAIETSYQLVRILASAHSNKIIYADTKPVHFYWHYNNRDPQQIYVIDWNCSQILPKDNLAYYQLDLKELVANIIFPLFTGRILAGSRSNKGSTPSEVEHQLNTEYKIGEWKKEEKNGSSVIFKDT